MKTRFSCRGAWDRNLWTIRPTLVRGIAEREQAALLHGGQAYGPQTGATRAERAVIFEEHTANKMTAEEARSIVLDSLAYADKPGERPYYHDQMVWVDVCASGHRQGECCKALLHHGCAPFTIA